MAATATSRRAKVKKGDQVVVMAGRDKGKRGRVLEVRPREGKVRVEGVAMIKRHQRPNPAQNRGGGIIDKEALIDISNVQLIDPANGKPTRVRYEVAADGVKTRVAAGSAQALDKE
jgi:large subunit ribosomal protein L24